MSDDVKRRLRKLLLEEVAPRFPREGERWQSAAAKVLGVSPSVISRLLKEPPEGGSIALVEAVAAFVNVEPVAILYGTKDEVPAFRDLPGYATALALAKARIIDEGRPIEPWALEKVGDFKSRPSPAEITADLLIALAAIHTRAAARSETRELVPDAEPSQ